jgi:hypothetical protein
MTMKIELPSIGHRNAVPWAGVCGFADTPLDGKVHWTNSDTKQIVESPSDAPKLIFRRDAVQRALPSFLGMALTAQEGSLENHAFRSAVGIITSADIEGNEIRVSGHIFGESYPDMLEGIKTMRTKLGMCMRYTDIVFEWPTEEKPKFAFIKDFSLIGIAIMHKNNCGFTGTSVRLLPYVSRRPCLESGCTNFVHTEQGFCPAHQPQA